MKFNLHQQPQSSLIIIIFIFYLITFSLSIQAQRTFTICPGEEVLLRDYILPPQTIDPGAPGAGQPSLPTCNYSIITEIRSNDGLLENGYTVAPLETTTYTIASLAIINMGWQSSELSPNNFDHCPPGQSLVVTVTIIVEECETVTDPIFTTYPWLNNFIDPIDCDNKSVYVYDADDYEFIIVKTDLAEILLTEEGKVYCMIPAGGFSFIELYDASRIINQWFCEEDIQGKLSTTKVHKKEIQLFPNPANKKIFINLQELPFEQAIITIYDVQGKQVKQTNSAIAFANIVQMDVSDLERGIYLLEVQTKDSIITEKLVIQ